MSPIKIIFAVDSPLYAPVHLVLALATKKHRSFDGFDGFEIAWDVSDPPKWDRQDNDISDPLIRRITRDMPRSEDKGFVLLGLCDPMRMASAPNTTALSPPVAVGCFISKMCYWALDSEPCTRFDTSENYLKKISSLWVHPKGMTGYAVPLHHLTKSYSAKKLELSANVFQEVKDPTKDRDEYEKELKDYRNAPSRRKPPGYVTTDPFLASKAYDSIEDSRQEVSLLHDYTTNPDFSESIMTAFLTTAETLDSSTSCDVIKKFIAASSLARNLLLSEPELASAILYRYAKSLHGATRMGMAYYSSSSPEQICKILEFLRKRDIYPTDPKIEPEQWKRSQEIHEPMDSLFQLDEHSAARRSVEALEYATFVGAI